MLCKIKWSSSDVFVNEALWRHVSVNIVGLWGRLECGEFTAEEFPKLLSEHSVCVLGRPLQDDLVSVVVNRKDLAAPVPEAITAIQALRAEGIKTGLLTNNVFVKGRTSYMPVDRGLFDAVRPLTVFFSLLLLKGFYSLHALGWAICIARLKQI